METELTEKQKWDISQKHRSNTEVVPLEDGEAVRFYDTYIVVYNNEKGTVRFERNASHINQITRRNMKYYANQFFTGNLVIKNWYENRPLFILNGVAKEMVNNEVQFDLREVESA